MRMKDSDIKQYPKLAEWLKTELPQVPQRRPKVWRAFAEAVPQFPVDNPVFLKFGASPKLEVHWRPVRHTDKPQGDFILRTYGTDWGMTIGGQNLIIINSALADRFHPGAPDAVTFLEATILHELIHWRREAAGLDIESEVETTKFEEAAYGQRTQPPGQWQVVPEQQYIPTLDTPHYSRPSVPSKPDGTR